ncbi:glutathione peroxidase [Chitinophagaceae bacterium LWZ2-11]
MTSKQSLLKTLYPVLMFFGNIFSFGKNVKYNRSRIAPVKSFYTLKAIGITGNIIDLSIYKGKNVLIVNTAGDCGFTKQYGQLEQLYLQNKQKLIVIGFPSNDFKEQEKGDDASIAEFCKLNYGVTFPLAAKSIVRKTEDQNEVFAWLTNASQNGWNDAEPSWNFTKYLINKEGTLTSVFAQTVSPVSKKVMNSIRS